MSKNSVVFNRRVSAHFDWMRGYTQLPRLVRMIDFFLPQWRIVGERTITSFALMVIWLMADIGQMLRVTHIGRVL
jgi:hypothetical protein